MKRLIWDNLTAAAAKSGLISQRKAASWDARAAGRLLHLMGLPESFGNYAQDCGVDGIWIISDKKLPYDGTTLKVRAGKKLYSIYGSGRVWIL